MLKKCRVLAGVCMLASYKWFFRVIAIICTFSITIFPGESTKMIVKVSSLLLFVS